MILCEQDLADFGFDFSLTLAQKIADELTNKDIELVLLDESAMRALNFEQRGVDKATDVLSFPLVDFCENLSQGVNFGDENLKNGLRGANFGSENLENSPRGVNFLGENLKNGLCGVNFENKNLENLPHGVNFERENLSENQISSENLQNNAEFLDKNLKNEPSGANFSSKNAQNLPLGSIVINANAVFSESSRLKHSAEAEFTLLFLHALLHLLGYNHEIDSGQMRTMEKRLIERFKLPQSLIIRNE